MRLNKRTSYAKRETTKKELLQKEIKLITRICGRHGIRGQLDAWRPRARSRSHKMDSLSRWSCWWQVEMSRCAGACELAKGNSSARKYKFVTVFLPRGPWERNRDCNGVVRAVTSLITWRKHLPSRIVCLFVITLECAVEPFYTLNGKHIVYTQNLC